MVEGENEKGPERLTTCRGYSPPAIVSNGNALTIFTFLNNSNQDYTRDTILGLDILLHYSVLDNGKKVFQGSS